MTDAATTSTGVGRDEGTVLLRLERLRKDFPIRGAGLFAPATGTVHAVNDVDLQVRAGEVLGLVGESGCGKTTLGRCLVGIERPTAGRVLYRTSAEDVVDLGGIGTRELRRYQREIRVIFQDPFASLNPRMTVFQTIADPLVRHRLARGQEVEDRVTEMMRRVGLSPGHRDRFPHAFSGGERQRIAIARALIVRPRLVVADEAVSALDVSVRAQILNLLSDLREELDLTLVFISHDLSVVENISDRVAVMYLGQVVEVADTESLYRAPRHPYTEALLSAVPQAEPRGRRKRRRIRLSDDLPDPANPPRGCPFHTRCRYADEECGIHTPELKGDHAVACHHTDALHLAGVDEQDDDAGR